MVYLACLVLDGTQEVHAKSDLSSEVRQISYGYHVFHLNELVYDINGNDKRLVKETLFIDWDAIAYFPYFLIVLTVLEVLRINRKADHKPFRFLKKLKEKKSLKDSDSKKH